MFPLKIERVTGGGGMLRMRYDDTYDVTESGDVVNVETGRVLSMRRRRDGYKTIRLYKPGHPNHYHGLVHRLVALVWIPNPERKPCVDHIDRNKHNNSASNLRWVTHSENSLNYDQPLGASGYRHIVQRPGGTWALLVNRRSIYHSSTHSTLEEAIAARDALLREV